MIFVWYRVSCTLVLGSFNFRGHFEFGVLIFLGCYLSAGVHSSSEAIRHHSHARSRSGGIEVGASDRQDERDSHHDEHTKVEEGGKRESNLAGNS